MRFVLSTLVLFAAISSSAQILNICQPGEENFQEFCSRMKHLRASINVFDQQREMTLVNYDYLTQLSSGLRANAERLLQIAPPELENHKAALGSLVQMGAEIQTMATGRNSDVFSVTNRLGAQCLACHDSSGGSGVSSGWNDVFRMNWSKVSQTCSAVGRNPYLCKSMNGMLTSYQHLQTAFVARIENFPVTASVSQEVLRILKDLKVHNFVHFAETDRARTESIAQELIVLAKAQDPSVFGKALRLTNSCNQCHAEDRPQTASALSLWSVSKK